MFKIVWYHSENQGVLVSEYAYFFKTKMFIICMWKIMLRGRYHDLFTVTYQAGHVQCVATTSLHEKVGMSLNHYKQSCNSTSGNR